MIQSLLEEVAGTLLSQVFAGDARHAPNAPLTIRGAKVWNGSASYDQATTTERDLHIADGKIAAEAHPHAHVIDLSGYTLFPGLVNAHDHLELNHYPRTKFREKYDNAHQWGEDVQERLNDEPFRTLRAYPLADRCFIGGLKNLLCGALTVAHHNPPHKVLFRPDFPVRVLKNYGWTHSLHFDTDTEIIQSYRRTPPDIPWFIHLAEGTDEVARGEYARLKALGCVGRNTVLVHGVGINQDDAFDILRRGVRKVWCPTSNQFLLGTHGNTSNFLTLPLVGSDSRLTANGDLLDELVYVGTLPDAPPLLTLTTVYAARELGLSHSGHLSPGAVADLLVLVNEHADSFERLACRRSDLALIMRGGVPQIGDPDVMAKFSHVKTVEATLDGVPKRINAALAKQIARCSLQEPGLVVLQNPFKRGRTI